MMGTVLTVASYGSLGLMMFNLGLLYPYLRNKWYRRKLKKVRSVGPDGTVVTKDDIRHELMRDPVAGDLFASDDTPDDVARYLFLEAERRAMLRKCNRLDDDENDFFAPPRHGGPDPGFRGCNEL